MSNTNASAEDNVESPSTYGNKAYKQYRKKHKKSKDATDTSSSQKQLNNILQGREQEEGQTFQY
jgi:hypothetical protein